MFKYVKYLNTHRDLLHCKPHFILLTHKTLGLFAPCRIQIGFLRPAETKNNYLQKARRLQLLEQLIDLQIDAS